MNLQETIRKVLREELSARVRRRVPSREMEKEFLESFEDAYNLTKRRKISQINFLDELINTTANMMMDGLHWRFVSTLPKNEFWYEDISTELKNHYMDRITQMYNERKGINESIEDGKKVYYGFLGLPNFWADDQDNFKGDKYFEDKDYEDYYFDNFYDMDVQFGNENSLFGTRGLPVGHPDRSSKSFNRYNEKYGPIIVRVVKKREGINESILREKTEKMSPFFWRRVNIDNVRDLLKINAEQVHYETESYEQFKYELTLKVVEAIMWNKYKLGWEDLPEQEEIEYVTKLSDAFEKTIKRLYHIYHSK